MTSANEPPEQELVEVLPQHHHQQQVSQTTSGQELGQGHDDVGSPTMGETTAAANGFQPYLLSVATERVGSSHQDIVSPVGTGNGLHFQIKSKAVDGTTTRTKWSVGSPENAGGVTSPTLPNEPYGENNSKAEVRFGGVAQHTFEESEKSSESDYSSTVESDGEVNHDARVHWDWTKGHIALALILTAIMCLCIGVWGATSPAEAEGDEFPNRAHLLSIASNDPAFYDLGTGSPSALLELMVFVQPMHTNATLTITLETELSEGVWGRFGNELEVLEVGNQHDNKVYKKEMDGPDNNSVHARLRIESSSPDRFQFGLHVLQMHEASRYKVVYAALILVGVYILIVFELIDRTLTALIGSFVALVVLAVVKERPTLEHIIMWIDFETVLLLFGMMIMVRIFSITGVFEFCAVKAYQFSRGDIWRLIVILCTFTATTSAFLDNVTTMLLLTPVTCRLCKMLKLDPTNLLLAEVMFSNIGGAATAVGDPPNIIIVNDKQIADKGITFAEFTLHMMIGAVMCFIAGIPFLKWRLSRFLEENKNQEGRDRQFDESSVATEDKPLIPSEYNVRESLRVDGQQMPSYTSYFNKHPGWNIVRVDEHRDRLALRSYHTQVSVERYRHNVDNTKLKNILLDNITRMESDIWNAEITGVVNLSQSFKQTEMDGYEEIIRQMSAEYKIRYTSMFRSVGLVLTVCILFFFVHSASHDIHLNLAWISLLGAMLCLLVSGVEDLKEEVLAHVEWETLLFFAGLFVLMESLTELGLIGWLGDRISDMINSVSGEQSQMVVAIVVLLWVSALASAFIDNIPYTTAMVPVIVNVSEATGLALKPLVFALAFGTCLGGNGTLIGASANVVTIGIAKGVYGCDITFMQFLKFGFPMMVLSVFITSIYLIIAHPVAGWNM